MSIVAVIYAIDVLTPDTGMQFVAFLFTVALIMAVIAQCILKYIARDDEDAEGVLKSIPFKTLYVILGFYVVYTVFVPSKDTSYKMLAAYGVEQVAENPDVKRLAGKSLEVLEKAMDEYTKKEETK